MMIMSKGTGKRPRRGDKEWKEARVEDGEGERGNVQGKALGLEGSTSEEGTGRNWKKHGKARQRKELKERGGGEGGTGTIGRGEALAVEEGGAGGGG